MVVGYDKQAFFQAPWLSDTPPQIVSMPSQQCRGSRLLWSSMAIPYRFCRPSCERLDRNGATPLTLVMKSKVRDWKRTGIASLFTNLFVVRRLTFISLEAPLP